MSKSEVQVNTAALRSYADQLGSVSRRVESLQERLMELDASSAGALRSAIQALDQGNQKIGQCRGYLNDTASDFETVERSIASRMS